jgi:hypothetical protein
MSNPNSYRVAITDEITNIVEDDTAPVAKEDGRMTYEIYNLGPGDVYLGDTELDNTGDTGMPLPVGSSRTIALRIKASISGICLSGETADVAVLQVP